MCRIRHEIHEKIFLCVLLEQVRTWAGRGPSARRGDIQEGRWTSPRQSKTEVKKVGQVHEERLRPHQREEPIAMRGTNERMGGKPQAQENESKLIQANKALEMRDRV